MVFSPGRGDVTCTGAYRFHPPRHSPAVMPFARWFAPYYLRYWGVTKVAIAEEDAARLERLRGERVVLAPNHPSVDAAVLFHLSTRLRLEFCWLAAREVFETPLQGWLVARTGAYSVDRGARDTDSLNTTRQLLREGRHWLVLFPEGENHYLHDAVLPFLPGAARLGFGALEDLARAGGQLPPLYVVPVATRYHYLGEMRAPIEQSLARLERKLGLRDAGALDWRERVTQITDRVLDANEELYGVTPSESDGHQERLERLREVVLHRAAESLGVELPPPDHPLRNRLRKLIRAANAIMHAPPEAPAGYARELEERRRRRANRVREELRRVLEFVGMTGTYILEAPTVERFVDVLGRLEIEVFGKLRRFGPREAVVRIGEPLDLRERFAEYEAAPEETSERVIHTVEHSVRELLAETARLMTPLPAGR